MLFTCGVNSLTTKVRFKVTHASLIKQYSMQWKSFTAAPESQPTVEAVIEFVSNNSLVCSSEAFILVKA